MEDLSPHLQQGMLIRQRGQDQLAPVPYEPWVPLPPLEDQWDFGRVHHANDFTARIARSTEDVQSALAEAVSMPGGLSLRGSAHSMNGQTLPDNGLQLSLRFEETDADYSLDESHRVTVPGSATWETVLAKLEPQGRSIGVLTDHPGTTVGGTLSVSGIGAGSFKVGRQVDLVHRLQVILPDGRETWCDAETEPDIFRATLAGLGGIGIIRRAVLNTIEFNPYLVAVIGLVPEWQMAVQGTAALTKAAGAMPSSLGQYRYGMGPAAMPEMAAPAGQYLFEFKMAEEAVEFAQNGVQDIPGLGERWAMIRVETTQNSRLNLTSTINKLLHAFWQDSPGEVLQLWNDFVFPDAELNLQFLSKIESDLAKPELVRYNFAKFGCLVKDTQASPHLPLSFFAQDAAPIDGYFTTQGFYFSVPKVDTVSVDAIKNFLRSATEIAFELGGRPYLYGWNDLAAADMQSGYGESWDFYKSVKRSVDPDCILSRGFFTRLGI